ncbi:phage head closure protein [Vibrio sp. V34_P3A8T189]|uniref:phage head closure protein n=1 Tax=unclassified Vibrio TaxID=2614977 RepID=UPI0013726E87|nr:MULTISPECIES: phage head closure protein [unclassified Vibrio]NAW78325.1 phage head closure protein [Vibrio sp. V33_P6A3T137]NAX01896.1 phage head closure protein [Vibrio sp. V34_P3A8T189]NAX08225.1 phage head closure protein [Vibrio sp. V40_P2S30T141]
MMQAGKLNQRITLYRATKGKSRSGAPTVELVKSASPWAELIANASGQNAGNDRERPENTYQWRLRWRENIEPDHWLHWRGRWMKITGVNDSDPRRQELILDAVANPKSTPPPIKGEE